MSAYKRDGQGNGFTIRRTAKGFLVEGWSAWSGASTGVRTLVYYSDAYPKDLDLGAKWNQYYDNGQMIYEHSKTAYRGIRRLSKGRIVH